MAPIRTRALLPFLVLLGAAALAYPAGAAPSPCSVDIELEASAFEAAVTSTAPIAVTIQGTYTVDKPSFERAVLTITATVNLGWAVTVSPSSVTISGEVGRTGLFTVTVVVPAGSLTTEVGLLHVEAKMVAGGIQCQGDQVDGVTITPLPYFDGLSGAISPQNVTLRKGAGSFTLNISAKANVAVSVSLELKGPAGLSFSAPTTVPLPTPGSGPMNATVTVRVTGRDIPPGTYQIEVIVHGSTAEGLTQQGQLLAPLAVPSPGDPLTSNPLALVGGGAAAVAAAGAFVWWRRR